MRTCSQVECSGEHYALDLCEKHYARKRRAEGGERVLEHATGKVRGLLCDSCNNGLGRFKDNPAVLRQAAYYVEVHG